VFDESTINEMDHDSRPEGQPCWEWLRVV
jgi:hypothetical protein